MKVDPLCYPARLPVILRYLGRLAWVLAVLNLVPLGVCALFGDWRGVGAHAGVAALLSLIGWTTGLLPKPAHVQANEGVAIVALAFLFGPLFAAAPMVIGGLAPMDAFFEAVSGVTTTGLSTVPDIEAMSQSFLFSRSWLQWYGGLGIMALALPLVADGGRHAMGLAAGENDPDDLVGGTQSHARRVLGVYTAITIIGVAALWAIDGSLLHAAAYTFAALSTGGFAPHNGSLGDYGGTTAKVAVTILCVAGAVPLSLYWRTRRERGIPRGLLEILVFCGFALFGTGVLWFTLSHGGAPDTKPFRDAVYTAFSAQSTAGFATTDLAAVDDASKIAIVGGMLVGGGAGSTAGGVKVVRVLLFFRLIQLLIARYSRPPHAAERRHLFGRAIDSADLERALSVILLFVGFAGISWGIFVICGYDAVDSLFEVVSALGTAGLSAGVTGPELPAGLKLLLCANMLLGRLEIVAWLVLLAPGTWIGKRRSIT